MYEEELTSEKNIANFNDEDWMRRMTPNRIIIGNRKYLPPLSLLFTAFPGLTLLFSRARSGVVKPIDNLLAAKRILLGIVMLLVLSPGLSEAKVQGGIVLMFDDGYSGWVTTIAPELARIGGVATAYVTLNSIRAEKLTYEDLRALQDCYGWEIGTHTNHHFNPLEFVKRKGLSAWISQELDPAIRDLRRQGLEVRNLSFPFDATSPEIQTAVVKRLESFRRPAPLALGSGVRADRSIPGTEISLANYVPMELIKKWIDLAHNQDSLLFLYGHQVLPDADFVTGTVEAAKLHTLTATATIKPMAEADLYLVPDTARRFLGVPMRVVSIEGKQVQVGRGDLERLTKPGATFKIGPGYGMSLSDFREMIAYAAQRLKFYTVHQVVDGQWRKN
jgi:peptidoglycan/xylan/chitin deacetylase (PgdA/CDA1 family)